MIQPSPQPPCRPQAFRTAVFALVLSAAPVLAVDSTPAMKLYFERAGAYGVSFEDLESAGLEAPSVPSAGLGLSCGGDGVPLWVEDGGDGVFGPGDHIEFLGKPLFGEVSYFSEYSRYNVCFLRFDAPGAARMTPFVPAPASLPAHRYRTVEHLEEDRLILRLPPRRDGGIDELWYWAKLVGGSAEPFTLPLGLDDRDPKGEVALRFGFRGWSQPKEKADPKLADHRVEVSLAGKEVAAAEWNGTEPIVVEAPPIPARKLRRGVIPLTFVVPPRPGILDVVMLNWVEVSFPRRAWFGPGQARFELSDAAVPGSLRLAGPRDEELRLYGLQGARLASPVLGTASFLPPPGETAFVVSRASDLLHPAAIVRDRPSRLSDTDQQADYLLITHRRFREAVAPLAELHRRRGLTVTVVDVEDVYDEFSHGVTDPRALRAFVRHAYLHWRRPAPRFVLLVGDASWDVRNSLAIDANYADWTYRPGETSEFAKNDSTPYAEGAARNDRNLIPTWSHSTSQGHSASDNFFVAVDGEDELPDLAIGRLPVVDPAEVTQIVAKIRNYVDRPEAGAWRHDVLFVTNDDPTFQRSSDRIAGNASALGLRAEKIYPRKEDADNAFHTRRLLAKLDEGQALVHFLGHGGRYIWRTGPPSRRENRDLFTLDDLEELQPNRRLPVVLSLTCYSAPFDHPSADSIGEKLLRLADRGAIAVFAASWRNAPNPAWGRVLVEELTAPGSTIGEAVMRAKHRIRPSIFVGTYNLLGDPAVPFVRPDGEIRLSLSAAGEPQGEMLPHGAPPAPAAGAWRVEGVVGLDGFAGDVSVDLVGAGGEVLDTETSEVRDGEFVASFELDAEESAAVRAVRAYAWDAGRGVDAAGGVQLAKPRPVPSEKARLRAERLRILRQKRAAATGGGS